MWTRNEIGNRLSRNDKGINELDEACKEHDIAYSQNSDIVKRHEADRVLANKAAERLKARDSSFGEKLASLGVKSAMKAKVKLGMGNAIGRKKGRKKRKSMKKETGVHIKGKALSFMGAIKKAQKSILSQKPNSTSAAVKLALKAVKGINKKLKLPRILPLPKSGGFLPLLIPLFAGLSALGALAGGASSIATAVNKAKAAREQLEEQQRHNRAIEPVSVGKGLYIKPYKKGFGLFVNPFSYYGDANIARNFH